MKVAIDSGPLGGGHAVRGIGFYTRNLVDALQSQAKKRKDLKIDMFDFSVNPGDLEKYDVVHYPYFDLFYLGLPLRKRTKTVVTVHDVIPLLYPKRYPPGLRGKVKFWVQRYSLQSVDAVITDTEASKKDIVRFLGIGQERIVPIHLAPAGHFARLSDKKRLKRVAEKYGLADRFVLYVGDVNYNKNVVTLARACKKIGVELVVVGKHAVEVGSGKLDVGAIKGVKDLVRFLGNKSHPETAHYSELLRWFEKAGVRRLGYVENEDLVALYNLATVYCFPSFAEGFGLSVLEAMACGCPVVCSRAQALVEISDGAAEYFNPRSVDGLVDVLGRVLQSSKVRAELVKKGYKNVSKFSWKKTAEQTFREYGRIA